MRDILKSLGLADLNPGAGTGAAWLECEGETLGSQCPIDGRVIANQQWYGAAARRDEER